MRVAVVGAGVLGASAAFHLALAGAEVVVADQGHAGRATAAGAGIVSPWSSGRADPDWRRIADAGARYYPELIQTLAECGEAETGYRRAGALSVAADEGELDGGRVAGMHVGSEAIEADRVVVAAGAWAPELLAPLGVPLAVAPQRGQIVHLRLEGVDTGDWPIVLPPGSHYLLAFEGSRVVAGATREAGSGFDHRVTAAGQAEVLNQALAVAPGLGPATLVETRVGFRPAGPDLKPMLGGVAGLDGLIVGNGLGASGLTIGRFAGRLLAQLALGEAPELDLAAYDPMRTPAGTAGGDADVFR